GARATVGGNRLVQGRGALEQARSLPLPAVKGFRRVYELCGEDSLARQFEGLIVSTLVLVEGSQMSQSVRGAAHVTDPLGHCAGLIQCIRGLAQESVGGVGERGTQVAAGEGDLYPRVHRLVRRLCLADFRQSRLQGSV